MYRTQCDDIILNIFFTLQCELFTQVAMFQIMPALCPHSQGRIKAGGEGGGWGCSTKCGKAWTGGVGVPKITKSVRTSFMDDPY